jgi:hypothetical protein
MKLKNNQKNRLYEDVEFLIIYATREFVNLIEQFESLFPNPATTHKKSSSWSPKKSFSRGFV